MNPVAIFRHAPTEGPGYFARFLENRGIPHVLIKIDENEPVPTDPAVFSGLVFMGGPMSVNDDLRWINGALGLILSAVEQDTPVLGHCLGAQLMAKALGAVVTRNPVKEIGWGNVEVATSEVARAWFGEIHSFLSFHWHGETFNIPEGATNILSSAYCENQGFALGKHLALQCHVEMTPELIRSWARSGAREIERYRGPSVESAEGMLEDVDAKACALNTIADTLYSHWCAGLRR
jgi:GMP synthase-like glutamine amidotransferase